MEKAARFMKVSQEQFEADALDCGIEASYDDIRLPVRATAGSAGYDFRAPADLTLEPGETLRFPTGIRARIAPGWVLMIFPRSSLGFKYRLQLNNTVGIIDSDYFGAENEGHIMIKMVNNGDRPVRIARGDAVAQGVFLPFGITEDDAADGVRVGGFGSTDRGK